MTFPITHLAAPSGRVRSAAHSAILGAVWTTFAASGIVFTEPAPVDALAMGLVVLLPLVGLVRFTPALTGYLSLWLVAAASAFLAATFATEVARAATHSAVSLYLYVFSFVLAGFVALKPAQHTRLVMSGTLAAALLAASAGLAGYFSVVPGAEMFTKFGRAAGTFKDPNVFGAFLVAPFLYCLHLAVTRTGRAMLPPLAAAGLLALGVLLSFSRGAWINLALATAIFAVLGLITSRTRTEAGRLATLLSAGAALVVVVCIAALQTDKVANLLTERASLTQSYDVGPEGRFGGQTKALDLIAENPFGIGATEFAATYHHEEVHNVFLSIVLNAGWLGGGIYWIMVAATILVGLRSCFVDTPARPLLIVAVAAFTANALEGVIIDSDHWRHFYVLMALVWGIAASVRLDPAKRRARA